MSRRLRFVPKRFTIEVSNRENNVATIKIIALFIFGGHPKVDGLIDSLRGGEGWHPAKFLNCR